MVGKPDQKIPRAPLQPISAFGEPSSRVLIDCVGSLPKSKSSNEYCSLLCPEDFPSRTYTFEKH